MRNSSTLLFSVVAGVQPPLAVLPPGPGRRGRDDAAVWQVAGAGPPVCQVPADWSQGASVLVSGSPPQAATFHTSSSGMKQGAFLLIHVWVAA